MSNGLRELILTPYLHKDEVARLKEYKYVAIPGTPLDLFYDAWIWTPAAKLVPRNIHPNTLTVVALICSFVLAYFPLSHYSPDFSAPAPTWVYLLSALSYFAYEVLDAIDGKQARKLKLSSPVGQMMDHGCDSLTTFYSIFLSANVARLNSTLLVTLLTGVVSLQLYLYVWYEYAFHKFKCSTGEFLGVSEGHLVIISMNLISAVYPDFWLISIYDVMPNSLIFWRSKILSRLNIGTMFGLTVIYMISKLIIVDYSDIKKKLDNGEKKIATCVIGDRVISNESSLREWMVIVGHWLAGFIIMGYGGITKHPLSITTIVAFSGSQLVWMILISTVGKGPLRLASRSFLPYYVTAIACFVGVMETPRSQSILLTASAVWSTMSFLRFVAANILMIRDYLNIPMFTVPPAVSKAV